MVGVLNPDFVINGKNCSMTNKQIVEQFIGNIDDTYYNTMCLMIGTQVVKLKRHELGYEPDITYQEYEDGKNTLEQTIKNVAQYL